ncbi:MAG: F0F1 ATP synthase subunit delta [Candidatus Magasanikbacteria bacterium]|nr:F0F1 ATP synthase subunit delta [Candidatus Magasanikbacteria bacterium]
MKRLTPRQWATALHEITSDVKESDAKIVIGKFVQQLRKRRALNLAPRIMKLFREISDSASGTINLHTTAAHELSASTITHLKELGTEGIIDHTIDPAVIGGVKIAMGDVIIDGTVATRLKKLL